MLGRGKRRASERLDDRERTARNETPTSPPRKRRLLPSIPFVASWIRQRVVRKSQWLAFDLKLEDSFKEVEAKDIMARKPEPFWTAREVQHMAVLVLIGSVVRILRTDMAAGHDMMKRDLLRALVLLVPVCLALVYSVVLVLRKAPWSRMLLVGAAFLLVVVLAHVCEACEWLPWMHWGAPDSPGHYLNLASIVLGMTLFPVGYALHFVTTKG